MAAKKGTRTGKATTPAKRYEPTEAELEAVKAYYAAGKERMPAPKVRVEQREDGVVEIAPNHPESIVWEIAFQGVFGTNDQSLASEHSGLLFNAVTKGQEMSEVGCNAALAAMHGIAPRDPVEGMLAAQMVAVHQAAMTMVRRLNHVENIDQQNSASNALNKLMRTFAAQVEALNRHRGKGQQKVTVEHVHVHQGGQAIVGTVKHGGTGGEGVPPKTEEQPHAKAIAHAPGETLPRQDEKRDALPGASREGAQAMQDARRGKG